MSTRVKETDEWKLGAYIEWRPKPMSIVCPRCHGEGTIGGGFKDIDGPRSCPECWGTKVKSVATTSPKPDVSADLVEHMRRAWWDYFNAVPMSQPAKTFGQWHNCEPPNAVFVLVKCPSGYNTTPWVYTTAQKDREYRGGAWINYANDRLTDYGLEPVAWMELPKDEA